MTQQKACSHKPNTPVRQPHSMINDKTKIARVSQILAAVNMTKLYLLHIQHLQQVFLSLYLGLS